MTEKGIITAMRKEGSGSLDSDSITDMMDVSEISVGSLSCLEMHIDVICSVGHQKLYRFLYDVLP